MKIQCTIERANGSEVTFDTCDRWPKGHYHFKPDPTYSGSPHLAEVTEERHINRFLSIDGFQVFHEPGAEPKPERPRAPSTDDGGGQVQLPPKVDAQIPAAASTVSEAKVKEIRDLTIKELKGKVNSFTNDELRAALKAEQENKDDKPRAGWIEVVLAHLGDGS